MRNKKPVDQICRNCLLFDGPSRTCSVKLMVAGQMYRDVPVDPGDGCLWEELGIADEIKQVRFRVVDPVTGEPTSGIGKVIMECDKGFFGQ